MKLADVFVVTAAVAVVVVGSDADAYHLVWHLVVRVSLYYDCMMNWHLAVAIRDGMPHPVSYVFSGPICESESPTKTQKSEKRKPNTEMRKRKKKNCDKLVTSSHLSTSI